MSKREYFFTQLDVSDIEIFSVGRCDCDPGLAWGPGVRNHYLFVYILSGRGSFTAGHRFSGAHHLTAGHLFLLKPYCRIFYQADGQDPWEYFWVSFQGSLADRFLQPPGEGPGRKPERLPARNRDTSLPGATGPLDRSIPFGLIPAAGREQFEAKLTALLQASSLGTEAGELEGVGLFAQIIGEIARAVSPAYPLEPEKVSGPQLNQGRRPVSGAAVLYCEAAKEFIRRNFVQEISVAAIAKYLGLDRSYFSVLFKEREGVSPGWWLLEYRMRQARTLLEMRAVSVATAAHSVGYADTASFSRAFRRFFGYPPSRTADGSPNRTGSADRG